MEDGLVTSRRIVIVEDDGLQSENLQELLEVYLEGVELDFDPVWSGSEFEQRFPSFVKDPPHLFIIDVMFAWSYPGADDVEPPSDMERGDDYTGGLRCRKRLLSDTRSRSVPTIFYTVLGRDDLREVKCPIPPSVPFVSKTDKPEPIVDAVRKALKLK
jgi:hypothetical protein